MIWKEKDAVHKYKVKRGRHRAWTGNEADSLYEYVVQEDGVHELKCDVKLTEVVPTAILTLNSIYTLFSHVNDNFKVNNLTYESMWGVDKEKTKP